LRKYQTTTSQHDQRKTEFRAHWILRAVWLNTGIVTYRKTFLIKTSHC